MCWRWKAESRADGEINSKLMVSSVCQQITRVGKSITVTYPLHVTNAGSNHVLG